MNKNDTKIINFNDNNSSVFTLKQGKSYNMTMLNKSSIFGKKKYGFVIINCVSTDSFTLEYDDKSLRDTDYKSFVNSYLAFNKMEE